MTHASSNANSFTLASRFLHAFQHLNKILTTSNLSHNFENLNMSQIRILQLAHDDPGIRADVVIEHLELTRDNASKLILTMEKAGLLALERSPDGDPPSLRLGRHSERLAFQIKATQLSILAELMDKLPETQQLAAVEDVERLVELATD